MAWTKKRVLRDGKTEVWDARVYVGGDKQYLYETKPTKAAADKWAREKETLKDKGERPTTDRRTLAEYLTEWLKLKERGAVADRNGMRKRIGPRTMDDYKRLVTDWLLTPKHPGLPLTGRTRLDKVTYDTLNALYRAMEQVTVTVEGTETKLAVGTIKKLNDLLGQVFYEAVQKGVLARNPAEWTNVPQADDAEADGDDSAAHAMDQDQADRFLSAARTLADAQGDDPQFMPERCWSALWHVLLGGGLRPGEAFALRWEDVHEITKTVQVSQNLIRVRGEKGYQLRKPKTKKSRRTIPLPESAWKELVLWKKAQRWSQQRAAGDEWQELGFVFTTSKGTPLHGARRSFARVCAKAGLGEWGEEPTREKATGPLPDREFTPAFRIYDLRHTYVTLLLLNGVPVNVVADLVGHEKPSFTIARYGHALPTQTSQAPVKLETLLFRTA